MGDEVADGLGEGGGQLGLHPTHDRGEDLVVGQIPEGHVAVREQLKEGHSEGPTNDYRNVSKSRVVWDAYHISDC